MGVIRIGITNSTTVDLSPFLGLNENEIDWGDDIVTTNTKIHNYAQSGIYEINANFEDVYKIDDNFSINNLNLIKFYFDQYGYEDGFVIGKNFLGGCTLLESLDMSDAKNLVEIGEGFLNNTNSLKLLFVPFTFTIPVLKGWGQNALSQNVKIYCGMQYDEYSRETIWNEKIEYFSNINYKNKLLSTDNILNEFKINLRTFPFLYDNNKIDLRNFPTLSLYLNNKDILCYDDIVSSGSDYEHVDPRTRQVYFSENDIKKTFFILRFKYKFKLENDQTRYYYVKLLCQAINKNGNFLEIKKFDDDTYYYIPRDEETVIISELQNKYVANNFTTDNEIEKYLLTNITEINEWQDYDDPNYARGKLVFGFIEEDKRTNITYEGDKTTGFLIKIVANGICKNYKIYNTIFDKELGRRPFLWIMTDKMNGGMIKNGDYIEINTKQGSKYAKLIRDDVEYNILNCINIDSTWLTLSPGENSFFAEADTDMGSLLNLSVSIIYNNLYEGI